MESTGLPGGDRQRRLELAGTETVPTAAAGAQLLSTHSVAACQDDQPNIKQSAASADAPTELKTICDSENLLIDGFIMPPGVLRALRELQGRNAEASSPSHNAGASSPSHNAANQGVSRIRGGAGEATGAAPARPLEADEDTAASPSGPASKRPRRTAARASDGPGATWHESVRGASEHEEAGGSAGSSVPSCSESDNDEEFLQKVEEMEQTVGNLTSRSTQNAERIKQMNANLAALASSQDVLLQRMAFLQQQLLEWEDEAATLQGDLAQLAPLASLQGPRSPSPSDVESSSFTGVL